MSEQILPANPPVVANETNTLQNILPAPMLLDETGGVAVEAMWHQPFSTPTPLPTRLHANLPVLALLPPNMPAFSVEMGVGYRQLNILAY